MSEVISKIVLSVLGVGGIFWAVLAASRKRPQILMDVKSYGSRESDTQADTHDVFFHVVFKNKSVDKNAVDKLIFIIWNKRRTEYIWESWAVKLYKPNKEANWSRLHLKILSTAVSTTNDFLHAHLLGENFYRS